ncbi:MAG: ribonuclease P protein component [Acidobacteriaceae bacterium]
MSGGNQAISAAAVCDRRALSATHEKRTARENDMADGALNPQLDWPSARLRKHDDYQRVYQASRKQFSPSMTYFFRLRAEGELTPVYSGPRVGLTAGRVLGKAVERNRIKRRMREAARMNLGLLPRFADVVLHPRKLVLDIEFAKLEREVRKVFSSISAQAEKAHGRGVRA